MTQYATKSRPYKDFLTPALHRRFISALSICFGFCYLESILIGEKRSLFWVWFPLGKTGLRTCLLCVPTLCIFLLRVAQLHVGRRTTLSGVHTFVSYAFRFQTVQTVMWYCLSAYSFGEIYLWSASSEAGLGRIKYIPRTNRSTLNEKPIYLVCFFFFLALLQAAIHLYNDYDCVEIPIQRTNIDLASKSGEATSAFQVLKTRLKPIALSSIKRSVLVTLISPIMYTLNFRVYPYSIRKLAWSINRSWAKVIWTLPKSGSLPTVWPFHWSILLTSAFSGFLLIFLWELSNAAFSIYTVEGPLRDGKPITEKSRDATGSLLSGLRSKKLQIRVYAFWELSFISRQLKSYRISIYNDIDRIEGSCWSQIRDICLGLITDISTRIDNFERPSVYVDTVSGELSSFPRISKPLKEGLYSPGDIFTKDPTPLSPVQGVATAFGRLIKSKGQSPNSGLSPKTKKLIETAEDLILTKEQKQLISESGFSSILKEWAVIFLRSHFGRPFRQEYRRVLAMVVLGTPYGDVGIILDAIESLSRLVVYSLTEDQYGNVQRDVKDIILSLTNSIIKLENFSVNLDIHWTDVMAERNSPEAALVLVALKKGLRDIVDNFEEYSENLGISNRELRIAKELVASPMPKRRVKQQQI